jgi:hypothetical protein
METGRYVLHTALIRIWSQLEGVMLEIISEYVQNNKFVCFRCCYKIVIIMFNTAVTLKMTFRVYYFSFCVICEIKLERTKCIYIYLNKKNIFTRNIYQSACDHVC